ncbi:hypothetical protein RclHR1_00590012 [Rhizophagus clarus]|uniref:Uncharacterized protein n=1 Tax=Rhizophagus clarus TaxID=94130 RepID=A0A2Z6RPN1_9GLOM|nr:hypothetical protein RclHR1_00590012 [Rhizophagus clarus]GES92473.1 hypothetical protein GLOIN_2v1876362 [Rhizophagus clarus]
MERTKDLLKVVLNITPGIVSDTEGNIPKNCSTFSMVDRIRQSLSFKYPVASYHLDWRIMLIIQYDLYIWSESSEKIINKKVGEMILMEYMWSFLEREWNNVINKSLLDSQSNFDEASNKVAKILGNTKGFLNDSVGDEPLALQYSLWYGILDLAQDLIKKI